MTATAAIDVDGLTKRFGGRTAVRDVSFGVARGEVFGFLGPNGAGKTTTVRILGTLLTPTSGSAVIAGIPLSAANAAAIRQRIAIMPEAPGLYRRLTVTENLVFFARLYGLPDRDKRIKAALDAVGLADRASDPCGTLSKGLRQRAALARTLLNDPAVLFLDEPTSGLDPAAAREVHDLITALKGRGVTVFLTTHRLDEAQRLCDRVAIMSTTLRQRRDPQGTRGISPTATILAFKATADTAQLGTRVGYALLFPALIPVLLPATMSAYSVVGEREQGTLEPVLTTPVRSAELLAGKALAIFVPTVGVAYVMFGVFFAITQLFAVSPVAAAVRHAPELPAELVFIPLLAAWAIWAGLAVSARASETRVAHQLSALASLPAIALVALMSFRVINPTFGVAAALAGGLVVIDCAACFGVSRMFDPERLITSTR
jgi:ABC-type Na+ transport system ATPase subunit NatA